MKSILSLVIFLLLLGIMVAQKPRTMNYQGYLTDSGGQPITSGIQDITFGIYDVASGGAALWTETSAVAVESGVFSVVMGENTAIDLHFIVNILSVG